jgi:hypothetical protein
VLFETYLDISVVAALVLALVSWPALVSVYLNGQEQIEDKAQEARRARRREKLATERSRIPMSELMKPIPCQVRSGTANPCGRPASVKIRGVPFCEPCAREQEAYFTIGELTEGSPHFSERALLGELDQMQRVRRRGGVVGTYEPDAA